MDDCYKVLRSGQISPEELLLPWNSINPSIQFNTEYSEEQKLYLDILIERNENGIWMYLYQNPTKTQRCLPLTSSHMEFEKIQEFGKLKIEFFKIPLPGFTNKRRISEVPFNTTKRLAKT